MSDGKENDKEYGPFAIGSVYLAGAFAAACFINYHFPLMETEVELREKPVFANSYKDVKATERGHFYDCAGAYATHKTRFTALNIKNEAVNGVVCSFFGAKPMLEVR